MFGWFKSKSQKEWEEKTSKYDERKAENLDDDIDLLNVIFNPNNNAQILVEKGVDAEFLKWKGYDIGKFDERYRRDENWTVENLVGLRIFGDDYKKLGFIFDNFFKFHTNLLNKYVFLQLGIVGKEFYELGFTFDNFFKDCNWEPIDYIALTFDGDLFKKLGFTFGNFFKYHPDWSAKDYKILGITRDNFLPDNLTVEVLENKGFCTELIDIILYSDENSDLPEALRYGVIEDKQRFDMNHLGDCKRVQDLQKRFEKVMKPIFEEKYFLRTIGKDEISSFIQERKVTSYYTNSKSDRYIEERFSRAKRLGLYVNSNDIKKEEKSEISRREAIMKRMYMCGVVTDAVEKPIEKFGDTIIEFNIDALRNKTTFTFGNSFESSSIASKITSPNIVTLKSYINNFGRHVKNDFYELERIISELEETSCSVERIKEILKIPYIELQFNGTIPFNSSYINAVHMMNEEDCKFFEDDLNELGIFCLQFF